MKRFIEGANREQSTLLPESLDEFIDDSNPVRAVVTPPARYHATKTHLRHWDGGPARNMARNLVAGR